MTTNEIKRIKAKARKLHADIDKSVATTDYTEEGIALRKALETAQAYLVDVLNV
jgi:hypothetical protein